MDWERLKNVTEVKSVNNERYVHMVRERLARYSAAKKSNPKAVEAYEKKAETERVK